MKTPIEMMMDGVQWKAVEEPEPDDSGLPHVTHQGELELLGVKVICCTLSTGQRIIDADSMHLLFEGMADAKK